MGVCEGWQGIGAVVEAGPVFKACATPLHDPFNVYTA